MAERDERRWKALHHDVLTGVTRAARDLGLAEKTLRAAIRQGELPALQIGKRTRLRIIDVRDWLDRCRRR